VLTGVLQGISGAVRRVLALRGGLAIMILGITALVIALMVATRPRLSAAESAEQVFVVSSMPAVHGEVQPQLTLFGEVVAGRRSELRALVTGPIISVGANFRDGGAVRKGELLLQIDPFDYENAVTEQDALLTEARLRLEKLRRDRVRAKTLFADKNVSQQFLDDAELAVLTQEAIVRQREVQLRRAERDNADTRLVAPYDGVVNEVAADIGKQLSTNDKVADITDTSRLELRFSLPNGVYGGWLANDEPVIGRPVKVIWRIGNDALEFSATVARIGAAIKSATGGVDAFAVIDTQGRQSKLRPGAFVQVEVADRRYPNVVKVPGTALYDENLVYVIADERLAARRVRVEGRIGSDVLVASAGEPPLREGDPIVISQLREAGPGSRVRDR
jgi:RND family efflux transporter MFP subunit